MLFSFLVPLITVRGVGLAIAKVAGVAKEVGRGANGARNGHPHQALTEEPKGPGGQHPKQVHISIFNPVT